MDLYQLECFRMVAELEHISNAAQRLHITQPALSKMISRVEDYAGCDLFDRVKGKIQLNASGKIFARTLDQMFTALNLGLEEIHALTREEANLIRVASSTDGIFLLIGDKFHVSHPDAQIRYSVMPQEHIRQEFMRGNLDFALTSYPLQDVGAEWRFISEEEVLLTVQPESPLWGRTQVSFSELRQVGIKCEAVGDPLRDKIEECCAAAGFKPNIVIESTIGSGGGLFKAFPTAVSFMPAHRFMQIVQSRPETEHLIRAVRLTGPECTRVTGIARRSERGMTKTAREFNDFIWDYFAGLDKEVRSFLNDYFARLPGQGQNIR